MPDFSLEHWEYKFSCVRSAQGPPPCGVTAPLTLREQLNQHGLCMEEFFQLCLLWDLKDH